MVKIPYSGVVKYTTILSINWGQIKDSQEFDVYITSLPFGISFWFGEEQFVYDYEEMDGINFFYSCLNLLLDKENIFANFVTAVKY